MADPETRLRVGTFAGLSGLSPSALRYYDEVDLLKPMQVDEGTGYRYYSAAQLGHAELVRFLRALDMPISEIRRALATQGPEALAAHLRTYRRKAAVQLEDQERMLAEIKLFAERGFRPAPYSVGLRTVPAQTFLSVRKRTPVATILNVMSALRADLLAYLGKLGVPPDGPSFTLYHNPDYNDVVVDLEVCLPTPRPLPSVGPVRQGSFACHHQAWTVHEGRYERIGQAYYALQDWLTQEGYTPAGPIRDICLVGPAETTDPDHYRTEVAWPVTGGDGA